MCWFKKVIPPTPTWEQLWRDEDTPLFYFGRHQRDPFTIGDSFKHVFAVGASGSGKTSGSIATIGRAYLQAGHGALILCAKPDERALWERYAKQVNRERDVVVVSTDSSERFNFLDYELNIICLND